jgi:hypothetical protein
MNDTAVNFEPQRELFIEMNLECAPYWFNIKLKSTGIEFAYTSDFSQPFNSNDESHMNQFRPLCKLAHRSDGTDFSLYQFYNSSSRTKCFVFYIINNRFSQTRLSSSLINSLFNRGKSKIATDSEILLIGTSNGYVFWHPMTRPEPMDLNENILLSDATSAIVYINSCRFVNTKRSAFDALQPKVNAKPSAEVNKNEDNCLFAVSRNGRVHVYAMSAGQEVSYTCCLLSQKVEICVKFTAKSKDALPVDYLVYCSDGECYSVKLSDCVGKQFVRGTCIHGLNVDEFIIGKFLVEEFKTFFRFSLLKWDILRTFL